MPEIFLEVLKVPRNTIKSSFVKIISSKELTLSLRLDIL